MKVGELFAELKLDDSAYRTGLDQAETKGGGFLDNFGGKAKLAVGGAMAGAGIAVGSFVSGSLSEFGNFESGMNEVFTLLPDLTGEQMGQMSKDVQSFAKEFGVLPEEVVPALYQAISAGVPPDNVFEFLEQGQKAALGGATDLETSIDGITSVVNAYGDSIGGAAEASDLMFTAVKLGKTDFSQLSGSLFNVVPVASSLGVEFGDVTAAIAAMTAQGTPTSVATTQMRQAFVELSKDGTKTSDLFKELTGKTFKEFIAGGGNTADALDILAEHADESGIGIADLFGSVEAGQAALALTGKGAETFRNNLDAMQESAGATETAYERMAQGNELSMARFSAALSVAKIQVGSVLLPALATLAGFVTEKLIPAIGSVVSFIDQNKAPFIAMATVILATLVPAFVTWAATAATAAAATVIALAPVLAPIAAIAAVAAALAVAWQKNFLGIRDITDQVIGFIKPLIEGAMAAIRVVVEEVVGFVKDLLDGDWSGAWSRASGWVTAAKDAISEALPLIWEAIKGFITETIPKIAEQLLTWASEFVAWIAPQIPPLLEEAGKFIAALLGWIAEKVPEIVGKLLTWGAEFVAWIAPQIPPLLAEAGKFLAELTGWIVGTALPAIIEKLVTWGTAFIGWVAKDALPFIVTKLWDLANAITGWIINDALPEIISKLVEWGSAFLGWIAKDALPFIAGELATLLSRITRWILEDGVPGLTSKLKEWASAFLDWIKDEVLPELPDRLGAILSDMAQWATDNLSRAGGILKDIGRAIMQGLWDGLKDIWGDVEGWFNGITDKIPDIKGPLTKDEALLRHNGRLIMQGLQAGMLEGWADVQSLLAGMTREIGATSLSPMVPAPAAAGPSAGSNQIAHLLQQFREQAGPGEFTFAPTLLIEIGQRELEDVVVTIVNRELGGHF